MAPSLTCPHSTCWPWILDQNSFFSRATNATLFLIPANETNTCPLFPLMHKRGTILKQNRYFLTGTAVHIALILTASQQTRWSRTINFKVDWIFAHMSPYWKTSIWFSFSPAPDFFWKFHFFFNFFQDFAQSVKCQTFNLEIFYIVGVST